MHPPLRNARRLDRHIYIQPAAVALAVPAALSARKLAQVGRSWTDMDDLTAALGEVEVY